ncbi:MAG: hypothetical protein ABI683_14970 [Ginsengibacter sp.]
MQHVEFFDISHFENDYHRVKPVQELATFIDFFWETRFDLLFQKYPEGFSDALFPALGYTFIINLGTRFIMQVDERKYEMKSDGFLPRHKAIECFHSTGNRLFGIKFKASPVIFEKKINFSEYKNFIFPLAYLLDQEIINRVKVTSAFEYRVDILNKYFTGIVKKYCGSLRPIEIVTEIINECESSSNFTHTIHDFAKRYNISTRTLQRYFESNTSFGTKSALQVLRIRKATNHLATSPGDFHYSLYGYYDRSHFYKHLKSFLQKSALENIRPHLRLLEGLHKD